MQSTSAPDSARGSSPGSGASLSAHRWRPDRGDRWALGLLLLWVGMWVALYATVAIRQAYTLAYPLGRILIEDQFNSLGDGRLIPRDGEVLTPAFAALFMAPVFWVHQFLYYPLADLLGAVTAVTIERMNLFTIQLLGTPLVYCLVRYAKAERWVAFALAAVYAASPFALQRMTVCNSMAIAPFLLLSELARIKGRPRARAVWLVIATFSYPLTGFSAVLLAFQDYFFSRDSERGTNLRILLVTAAALAVVNFGVLVLWPMAQPSLTAQAVTFDGHNLLYPVFPYPLGALWAMPVKLFEMATLIAGSCVFLITHPSALFAAIVDLLYFAGTGKGIRDHTMTLSTVGLLPILAFRASLFRGSAPGRNRTLVGAALLATLYGHVLAGPNGLIQLALAPDPPQPHLKDLRACIPPGQRRCLTVADLYAGLAGHCEDVGVYVPVDLESLRIDDDSTTVFVTPARFQHSVKGRPYRYDPPRTTETILQSLAAKIRSGELHATVCTPSIILVRSPRAAPNDVRAASLLERPLGSNP